jgi:hypothetical protein
MARLGTFSPLLDPRSWFDKKARPEGWFTRDLLVTATSGAYVLTANSGAITLAGQSANVKSSRKITANSGAVILTGQNAALNHVIRLTANSGTVTLAGQSANVKSSRRITANSAAIALAGQNANLAHGIRLTANSGTVALAGQSVTLKHGIRLVANSGTVTLAGQNATLTFTGSTGAPYTLTATHGAVILAGGLANLKVARSLISSSSAITLVGQSASIKSSRKLTTSSGAVTLAGQDVALKHGIKLTANSRAIALAGQSANIYKTKTLSALSGSINILGFSVALTSTGKDAGLTGLYDKQHWYNKDTEHVYYGQRLAREFRNDRERDGVILRREIPITASATTDLDWDTYNLFSVAVGISTTFTFSNPRANSDFVIVLTKDNSSTTRTIVWPPALDWAGQAPFSSLNTANEEAVINIAYYAGKYRVVSVIGSGFGLGQTSGDITHQRSEAGSVKVSVKQRLDNRMYMSDFGVAFDGFTDNTTKMETAISKAYEYGETLWHDGGPAPVVTGPLTVGGVGGRSLTIKSEHTSHKGFFYAQAPYTGKKIASFMLKPGLVGSNHLFTCSPGATATDSNNLDYVKFENIGFAGNTANNPGVTGNYLIFAPADTSGGGYPVGIILDNVYFQDCKSGALVVGSKRQSYLTNVNAYLCGNNNSAYTYDFDTFDVVCRNVYANGNPTAASAPNGFIFRSGSQNILEYCASFFCNIGATILGPCADLTWLQGSLDHNWKEGLNVAANTTGYKGGRHFGFLKFQNNGQLADASYYDAVFSDLNNQDIFSNCYFMGDADNSTKRCVSPIGLVNTSTPNQIRLNNSNYNLAKYSSGALSNYVAGIQNDNSRSV